MLVDALEESELTPFEPEIGSDVREQGNRVSDALEVIETEDPEKDYKIEGIIAVGYETYGSEDATVIEKARVRIFRLAAVKTQESENQGA